MAKIVVVDDEADVIELVTFVLERDGHQVLSARDGKKGLAIIQEEMPDLVILDVMMPEMDGYTVNSNLLENEKTRDIPVIILTAKGKVKDLFQMSPNVKGYMGKPFEPMDLKDKIKEILNKLNKRQ